MCTDPVAEQIRADLGSLTCKQGTVHSLCSGPPSSALPAALGRLGPTSDEAKGSEAQRLDGASIGKGARVRVATGAVDVQVVGALSAVGGPRAVALGAAEPDIDLKGGEGQRRMVTCAVQLLARSGSATRTTPPPCALLSSIAARAWGTWLTRHLPWELTLPS